MHNIFHFLRQYAKWKEEKQEPDFSLKPPEKERRPSLRETKVKKSFYVHKTFCFSCMFT